MGRKNNKLSNFLSSSAGKRLFNILYSWGASVVIVGAMFKILHLPGANAALMIGMITEALVFFFSGLDNSDITENNQGAGQVVSSSGIVSVGVEQKQNSSNVQHGNIAAMNQSQGQSSGNSGSIGATSGGTVVIGTMPTASSGVVTSVDHKSSQNEKNTVDSKYSQVDNGSSSTIVVGNGGGSFTSHNNNNNRNSSTSSQPSSTQRSSINDNTGKQSAGNYTEADQNYVESLSQVSHNMNEFSSVMGSLSQASSSLLDLYKQISDSSTDLSENSKNFVDNMKALNNNVLGLNTVYESQLHSISEQMATVKYINESLDKIKKFYSDTLVDSSIFKDETEKMTKQIEALNQVYARLLRAMTSSGGASSI